MYIYICISIKNITLHFVATATISSIVLHKLHSSIVVVIVVKKRNPCDLPCLLFLK